LRFSGVASAPSTNGSDKNSLFEELARPAGPLYDALLPLLAACEKHWNTNLPNVFYIIKATSQFKRQQGTITHHLLAKTRFRQSSPATLYIRSSPLRGFRSRRKLR